MRYGLMVLLVVGVLLWTQKGWLFPKADAKRYGEAVYNVTNKLSDDMELRMYEPQLVAEVTASGTREEAAGKAFRILFSYITGNNIAQQKVPMTVPVVEKPSASRTIPMTVPVVEVQGVSSTIAMTVPVTETQQPNNLWTMRFFMPAGETMATIPKPKNDDVKLVELPGKLMAVVRFSGIGNEKALKIQTERLQNVLNESGHYTVAGAPEYAFYNAPFTLPVLRRNEVHIPVFHVAKALGPLSIPSE